MSKHISKDPEKRKKQLANLQPTTSISKEEARQRSINGGIATGKIKKQQKELRDRIKIALDYFTKQQANAAQSEEAKQIIKDMGIDVYILHKIAIQGKSSPRDKAYALNMLWDRLYGKPKDTVAIEGSEDNPLEIKIITEKKGEK